MSDPTSTSAPTSDPTDDPGTTEPAATTTGEPIPTTGTPTTDTTDPTDDTTTASTDDTTTDVLPVGCEGDAPKVRFETTLGVMTVQLDAVNAPNTVANFVDYVETGFYDNTIFHRVVDGFVIQGGGYTPGLQQKPTNPPIDLEISPNLTHVNGAIAMARTNDPNSATSQFYLCDGPQGGLNGEYAVFGVLIEGFDVLAAISAVPVGNQGQFMGVPLEDVIVTTATCVP